MKPKELTRITDEKIAHLLDKAVMLNNKASAEGTDSYEPEDLCKDIAQAQLAHSQKEHDKATASLIEEHRLNLDGTVASYEQRIEEERRAIGEWLNQSYIEARGNTDKLHKKITEGIVALKQGIRPEGMVK